MDSTGASDIEERIPTDDCLSGKVERQTRSHVEAEHPRDSQGRAEHMTAHAEGFMQGNFRQTAGSQHAAQQAAHGYKYFAKGMDLALQRLGDLKPVSPKVYSALIQRGKESKRWAALV